MPECLTKRAQRAGFEVHLLLPEAPGAGVEPALVRRSTLEAVVPGWRTAVVRFARRIVDVGGLKG